MPTDLEHDLRRLGDAIWRSSAPISTDEVAAHHRAVVPDIHDLPIGAAPQPTRIRGHAGHEPSPRRPWLTAAAVTLVLGGVGAIWVTARPTSDSTPADQPHLTQPPAEPTTQAPLASNGALLLDPVPDGWVLERVDTGRLTGGGASSTRIYAVDSPEPESAPALMVDVIDNDAGRPDIPTDAEPVDVHGVTGSLYARPPGVAVSFETDGYWIDVTGYQVSRDELLAAAEHTRLDGLSAVIDPTGLPASVVERATGIRIEAWFIDQSATAVEAPQMHWQSANGASMWLLTVPGTPEIAALGRIGAATVTDVDVNGRAGFITTSARDDQYRSLTWTADGRIHRLGSRGLDNDQLVDLAAAMRTATLAEWDQTITAAAPPPATIPADGGLPEPGSVVPHRVTVFPAIDESLVPDQGRGATFAYSTYSQAGIEIDGQRWIGAVGPNDWTNPSEVVNIAVTDPDLVEPVLGEPTRDPDITESQYESATGLTTTVDGVVIQVTGVDVDVLYGVIGAVHPTIVDGHLDGYTVDPLPYGLVDLTGPVGTGWAAGAFPTVNVHNGALTMQVRPEPAVATLAAGGTDTEPVDVASRPGYLFTSPDSPYQVLTIVLDDHTSLILTSSDLTRSQLLEAAGKIELVDEATWQAKYGPTPAVIPTVEAAPTSTTRESVGD